MFQSQFIKTSKKPFFRKRGRTVHFQIKTEEPPSLLPIRKVKLTLVESMQSAVLTTINSRFIQAPFLLPCIDPFFQRNKPHYRIQQRSFSTAGLPYNASGFSPFQFHIKTGEQEPLSQKQYKCSQYVAFNRTF